MFEEFDKRISILSESLARSLSRRRMVTISVKGAAATLAGATLGIFTQVHDAFAITCTCNWYDGSGNANCPNHSGCNTPGYGVCPPGCSPCTNVDYCYDTDSGYYCNYPNASWTSCTGLGTCGNGHKICVDCKCPNCSYVCTCLSNCICCNCCTPMDVEAEMRRLAAAGITGISV